MTREERLKLCEICTHCKRDIDRGMVCGLTNEYADFEGDCPQFVASQHYLTQQQAKATASHIEEGVNLPFVFVAVFCVFVFYAFMLDGSTQPMRLLLVIGSILLSMALVMLAYGYVKGRKAQQSASKAIPLNLEILEKILRAEGYYPQKMYDNTIMFKRQGEAYVISYNKSKFTLRHDFPIETDSINAHLAAMWVMEKLVMVKVWVQKNDEDPNLQDITLSIENLIDTVDALTPFFTIYVQIIETAKKRYLHGLSLIHQRVAEEQADNEPPRRNEVYIPAFYWLPQLVQAYCGGEVPIEALTDEAWIRNRIQSRLAEEDRSLWESFRIERVERYGDYKLYIYRFPEPQVVPEAKYGAVLLNTTAKTFDYYTLELSYNGKWVYGSMQGEVHRNYAEVDTDDLDKFIEWIFSHDKQLAYITDCVNCKTTSVN